MVSIDAFTCDDRYAPAANLGKGREATDRGPAFDKFVLELTNFVRGLS